MLFKGKWQSSNSTYHNLRRSTIDATLGRRKSYVLNEVPSKSSASFSSFAST